MDQLKRFHIRRLRRFSGFCCDMAEEAFLELGWELGCFISLMHCLLDQSSFRMYMLYLDFFCFIFRFCR